jgi:hypothetical protein
MIRVLMRARLFLLIVAIAVWSAACGDDDAADTDSGTDASTDTDTDTGTGTDAGVDAGTDAGSDNDSVFTCWDGVVLGEGGSVSDFALTDTDGSGITEHVWMDDAAAPAYALSVESWEGYGGPTTPGTYEITATETNYASCGLCVRLSEVTDGTTTKAYMPVEGSGYVTLDSLTIGVDGIGTVFAGSYDLELQEVSDTDWATPVTDGCTGGSKYAWSGKIFDGVPADVGEPLENASFMGFADANLSNTIDEAEQADVEFSFDSIYAATGKKTLVVMMGRELCPYCPGTVEAIEGVAADIQAANGLIFISYYDEGGWTGTAGSYDHMIDMLTADTPELLPPSMNYITNQMLPWLSIPFVPYQFVIDLETRTVLGKDTSSSQMTAPQILTIVQANNE